MKTVKFIPNLEVGTIDATIVAEEGSIVLLRTNNKFWVAAFDEDVYRLIEHSIPKEWKLLILLFVALDNGWKPFGYFQDLFQITHKRCLFKIAIIENNIVYFRPVWNISFNEMSISLNDLVTNWEQEESSFIEALVWADTVPIINLTYNFEIIAASSFTDSLSCDWKSNAAVSLRLMWNLKSTSERLQWLFDTFKHLLPP